MYKDTLGGGKGGGSNYDPQIGRAAGQAARTAQQAQDFSEKYFNEVITPLLKQQGTASIEAQGKLGKLYDINAEQMGLAHERYKKFGIPAEERYYDMVSRYSEPEEFERQATLAKGDFATAQAVQKQQQMRQMAALGIDPTSPAAVAAMSDQAVLGAAAEASAMNRARNAARTLGMQLTSDAANFGRGGQSGILQVGAGAQGNATGAFGVANAALGTGMNAGNSVLAGYNTALSGYSNIMDNYARLGVADINAQAQTSGGFGQFLGMLGGAAITKFSDVALKKDLLKVGKTPAGIDVYEFSYLWDDTRHVGVIAQDVQKVIPEAVIRDKSGFLRVDYSKVR